MQGLRKVLEATGLDGKALGEKIGADKYTISRYMNGRCNPTPEVFRAMLKVANLAPSDVATAEEVDYGIPVGLGGADTRHGDRHKIAATLRARILPKLRVQVDRDLATLGYSTVQAWIEDCVKQLHIEAERQRGRG